MIALDANVLIALLTRNDPHHLAAVEILARHQEAVVHVVNLAESLVAPQRAGRARPALSRLEQLGVTEADRQAFEALTLAELRVSTGLKLPDCCPLLVAESAGIPVGTFDERIKRAAMRRAVDVEPAI